MLCNKIDSIDNKLYLRHVLADLYLSLPHYVFHVCKVRCEVLPISHSELLHTTQNVCGVSMSDDTTNNSWLIEAHLYP